MILFQVRDLAAKACGEPHVAPSWEIAKASLGAMLAKTPELAERAHSLRIELCAFWDPTQGVQHTLIAELPGQSFEFGDVCLAEFRAACAKEEHEKQEEADRPFEVLKKSVDSVLKKQAEGQVGQRLKDAVSDFERRKK